MGIKEQMMAIAEIRNMIRQSIRTGSFTLASGRKSSYYVDLREVLFAPGGAALAGQAVVELLRRYYPLDSIGGPEMASVPIVAATLCGTNMRGFVVRRERKDHGAEKLIEGCLRQGDRIAVIDDVATSGASLARAVRAAEREFGAICVVATCLLDRQEGAEEHLRALGIPFEPIFRINALACGGQAET